MDRDLYLAATAGNAQFLNVVDQQLLQSKAPRDNTALHIAARHGRGEFSRKILELCGPLLMMKNSDDDTPLHFAARNGYLQVVQILVDHARGRMTEEEPLAFFRMQNKEGNTALHEALRNLHQNVAIKLLEVDPKLSLSVNNARESPFHLAVKLEMNDVVEKILGNDSGNQLEEEEKRNLVRMQDDVERTALHYAAKNGNVEIVEKLPTCCPDAVEQVDQSRRNLLHIAMLNNGIELAFHLLKRSYIVDILNQQDEDGNTPLHLVARDIHLQKKTIKDFILQAKQKGANLEIFNQDDLTAEQVLSLERRRFYEECDEIWEKKWPERRNAIMVALALIATVTFTAAFTVPGGFRGSDEPNPGTAVLINNNFFKAFMLFDTTATCTSVVSLFLCVFNSGPKKGGLRQLSVAGIFFGISLYCMMAALATGVYVVVAPRCLWLAWLIFVACISAPYLLGLVVKTSTVSGSVYETIAI